jgi:hypothetical protein
VIRPVSRCRGIHHRGATRQSQRPAVKRRTGTSRVRAPAGREPPEPDEDEVAAPLAGRGLSVDRHPGRAWAALMLASTPDLWASILRGLPVMVRRLDPEALRRALRGAPPPPLEFVRITPDNLDALAECGPLHGGRSHT